MRAEFVKRFLQYTFIFFVLSCSTNSAKTPPISHLSQLRASIQKRVAKGDTMAHSQDELLKALPDNLSDFTAIKKDGGTFQLEKFTFSQASKDYIHTDSNSMIVRLADYAADSTAFYHLFDRFLHRENKDSLDIPGGFGWNWESQNAFFLEVGYQARYHLTIQSNYPLSKPKLDQAFKGIEWGKITSEK